MPRRNQGGRRHGKAGGAATLKTTYAKEMTGDGATGANTSYGNMGGTVGAVTRKVRDER